MKKSKNLIVILLFFNVYLFYHEIFGSNGFLTYKDLNLKLNNKINIYERNDKKLNLVSKNINNVYTIDSDKKEQIIKQYSDYARANEKIIIISS